MRRNIFLKKVVSLFLVFAMLLGTAGGFAKSQVKAAAEPTAFTLTYKYIDGAMYWKSSLTADSGALGVKKYYMFSAYLNGSTEATDVWMDASITSWDNTHLDADIAIWDSSVYNSAASIRIKAGTLFRQYDVDNAILFSITQGYITLQKAS